MKWLIDYIRSCFCKHEWELLNKSNAYRDIDFWGRTVEPYAVGTQWTYRCKKCGYCKTYKDYE